MVIFFLRFKGCSVYEICPQSEMPQLIQVVYFYFVPTEKPATLLPGTVIWYDFCIQTIYGIVQKLFC